MMYKKTIAARAAFAISHDLAAYLHVCRLVYYSTGNLVTE